MFTLQKVYFKTDFSHPRSPPVHPRTSTRTNRGYMWVSVFFVVKYRRTDHIKLEFLIIPPVMPEKLVYLEEHRQPKNDTINQMKHW